MPTSAVHPNPQPGAVVTKATLRAAGWLDLRAKTLAAILGVSEATISRMHRGDYQLEPGTKPFELGVLFVRLYRSLDAIVGGDKTVASQWLKAHNTALGGIPIERITSVTGLVDALAYLDARRALI